MKTFLANLKHVSRDTEIGGGTFTVETVAHLRGMELERQAGALLQD